MHLNDYYAPLDSEALLGVSGKHGSMLFKNNCIFCHSIYGVGGNKGGFLLEKFNFQLNSEKNRFKDSFVAVHGQDNVIGQNTKQFLVDGDLEFLSIFLSEIHLR